MITQLPTYGQSTPTTTCGDPLALQVFLDRQGFSPGVIDGKPGRNTDRALAQLLAARSAAGCEALSSLGLDPTQTTTEYPITSEDVTGPFVPVPEQLVQQAALPQLGYSSAIERIAERFHTSPALLEKLNPGLNWEAGTSLVVPNVEPFDERVKPQPATPPAAARIEVDTTGTLRAVRRDGTVIFVAPVSSGSEHDPLPVGTWKVTGVSWLPKFHYNPKLFWDAEATDVKSTIQPGPNNPVGVVWIDINVPHYGIHGTPEPTRIGYTQSHGCVRMTNWDAARLAALVGVNTPVVFK